MSLRIVVRQAKSVCILEQLLHRKAGQIRVTALGFVAWSWEEGSGFHVLPHGSVILALGRAGAEREGSRMPETLIL